MAKGFAKPKNVGKTFARLFGYLRPHAGKLAVVAVLLLINSLSGVVGTYLLKPIFNIAADMFKTGSRDFGPILRNILLLAGVYVAGAAANYGVNFLLMRMNTRVLSARSGVRCSSTWKSCPSNTSTAAPTARSCPGSPTTPTPCGRCSATPSPT